MSALDVDIKAQIRAERERLVEVLEGLTSAEWDHQSLCDGWRVREVVAHITMPFRTSLPRLALGLAATRFSFNRYADTAARRDAARMSASELLGVLRDNISHPWQPPGAGPVAALSHDTIHGLDITEPLGLPPAPAERIAVVLAGTTAKNLAYFGVDLTGIELRATDADVRLGAGETVEMPVKEILLTATGRRPAPRLGGRHAAGE
ncbi:MAG TPA: maleylpyruvate isomerase family mycothiol-dependent enzyme [Micromonosporaceae bacterium]|nr:maleylpyruvate isomerase family mycothiol-dependent enzyme [Micromonosporaceae bacterium]